MTIRADRAQILCCICMFRVSARMKWLKVVHFNELSATISIDGFEIKSACRADIAMRLECCLAGSR